MLHFSQSVKYWSTFFHAENNFLPIIDTTSHFPTNYIPSSQIFISNFFLKPKSVIRISQCCMAMRSPLISPRWTGKTALFLKQSEIGDKATVTVSAKIVPVLEKFQLPDPFAGSLWTFFNFLPYHYYTSWLVPAVRLICRFGYFQTFRL